MADAQEEPVNTTAPAEETHQETAEVPVPETTEAPAQEEEPRQATPPAEPAQPEEQPNQEEVSNTYHHIKFKLSPYRCSKNTTIKINNQIRSSLTTTSSNSSRTTMTQSRLTSLWCPINSRLRFAYPTIKSRSWQSKLKSSREPSPTSAVTGTTGLESLITMLSPKPIKLLIIIPTRTRDKCRPTSTKPSQRTWCASKVHKWRRLVYSWTVETIKLSTPRGTSPR